MDIPQMIGIAGAAIILIYFGLNQFGKVNTESFSYDLGSVHLLDANYMNKTPLVRQNTEKSAPKLRFGLGISRYASASSSFLARLFGVLTGRENVNTT